MSLPQDVRNSEKLLWTDRMFGLGTNPTLRITLGKPRMNHVRGTIMPWGWFFIGRDWEVVNCCQIYGNPRNLQEPSGWSWASLRNRIMTISMLLKLHWSVSKWKTWIHALELGPVSSDLRLIGYLCKFAFYQWSENIRIEMCKADRGTICKTCNCNCSQTWF